MTILCCDDGNGVRTLNYFTFGIVIVERFDLFVYIFIKYFNPFTTRKNDKIILELKFVIYNVTKILSLFVWTLRIQSLGN